MKNEGGGGSELEVELGLGLGGGGGGRLPIPEEETAFERCLDLDWGRGLLSSPKGTYPLLWAFLELPGEIMTHCSGREHLLKPQ